MREAPQSSHFGPPGVYRDRWQRWVGDPLIDRAGITFDRAPSGAIVAPTGTFRVCAYHVDVDERPSCWLDVDTLAEARYVCANLSEAAAGWNVDVAVAYDDAGGRAA